METLLGVLLGGFLTMAGYLAGSASTYVLLRGLPKMANTSYDIQKDTPQDRAEYPDIPDVVFPSMEGTKPPPADSWEGGDIGPVVGSSDADALATYQILQEEMKQGKAFPDWLPDYWDPDWRPQ